MFVGSHLMVLVFERKQQVDLTLLQQASLLVIAFNNFAGQIFCITFFIDLDRDQSMLSGNGCYLFFVHYQNKSWVYEMQTAQLDKFFEIILLRNHCTQIPCIKAVKLSPWARLSFFFTR